MGPTHASGAHSAGARHAFEEFSGTHAWLDLGTLSESPVVQAGRDDPIRSVATLGGHPLLQEARIALLLAVRNTNRDLFRALDPRAALSIKPWPKSSPQGDPQGGGVMSIFRGDVLEKAAVNMSVVTGPQYPSIEKDYAGKPFTAAGVSLICHPKNPNAPIAHMNVRILTVGEGDTAVTWVGGGADLTPMVRFAEDTQAFHGAMEDACARNSLGDYPRFRDWCDEYFFMPHRGETRGVGGVFFDYLTLAKDADLSLLLDVGQGFARVYGEILARRLEMPYDDELKERHLHWRGRYAEFNLAYDRGTRFGLMSGGNVEAIFASLPPIVKW